MSCCLHRAASGSGAKAISTSSVRHFEKKPEDVPTNRGEKTDAHGNADQTQSPAFATQKAEDGSKLAEQREEPMVLQTDDGSSSQQQTDAANQVKTDAPKSGKESLLDLLGAMKVEVTNKRKLKMMKMKQSQESAPKSHPAALESTISMFQKATEEASQR